MSIDYAIAADLSLPAPLTSNECDLRGLEWMPLYGDRLFASDTWLLATPEGRCAAMMLWWAAWKQRPAGSLPDQDRALAQLAGYGPIVKSWLLVKDEALRGWVRCSDGRLYHPIVCKFALQASERRVKERTRKSSYRNKMDGTSDGKAAGQLNGHTEGQIQVGDGDRDGDRDGDCHVERRTEERRGERKKESKKGGEGPGEPTPPAEPAKPRLKPRTPVGDDWLPNENGRRLAKAKSLHLSEIQKFVSYHQSRGNLMADWNAAWRTWCIKAAEWQNTAGLNPDAPARMIGGLD